MNAPVAAAQHRADANSSYGIIDCDIHPFPKEGAIARYLPERWRRPVDASRSSSSRERVSSSARPSTGCRY